MLHTIPLKILTCNKKAKLKAIKGKSKTSNKIFSSNPKKSRLSFSVDSLLKKKFSTRIEEDEETSEADGASEADEATSGCYTCGILGPSFISGSFWEIWSIWGHLEYFNH